ncbi:CopD family protein [Terrabacter sp. NPDC000476]|uniref:CopD family protein n=1 Tax=Terrabacter sp. NPDC000476 TaxID=3154258 RepID=UPI0033295485
MNDVFRGVLGVVDDLALLVGFVLVAGTLASWVTMAPNGRSDRRQVRLVHVGAVVLGVATLAVPLLAPRAGADAGALVGAVSRETWTAGLVRLAVLVALLAWADELVSGPITASRRRWAGVAVVTLSATFVLPSEVHGSLDGPAGALVDVALLAHVVAAAVWLGGALVIAVVGLPTGDLHDLSAAVRSFSRITLATVATVVVSGVVILLVQASDGASTGAGYGAMLLVKGAAFVGMVVAAHHGRRRLDGMVFHRLRVGSDALSRVQASSLLIGAQLVLGAVLLGATVALGAVGPSL